QMGIPPLTAHFFVFYFAVVSAITPPVALASYAAAAISGAKAMETSVASFKIGLAAFIVPFMFFYNSALLMDASAMAIVRALITALVGVYLLSSGVQAWFLRYAAPWYLRILLIVAAFLMIEGGIYTDLAGIAAGVIAFFVQKMINGRLTQAPS
ncbi:MAG: TRAP transporter large permease subunit, partial [Pseudohongiellaceae bacterium]